MKFYNEVAAERPRIERAIRDWGYAAEHHFPWYEGCLDPGERNVFVESENGALLTVEDKASECTIFSSPLAPAARRGLLIVEYLELVFSSTNTKKVWLELEAPLRREVLR